MSRRFAALVLFLVALPLRADAPKELTVEQLAERYRKSVVVITSSGRDGRRQGLGSGFIISSDGLIATNLHVIGEGRAISVELSDGKKHAVVAIQATDRTSDLALIRIDAKNLPALELGDSDQLKDGQSVVGLGNPEGLRNSVVTGVVSGRRMLDGRNMIQLAIPLEPGNSGGPLLDRFGNVQGILTLKSAITENLGFAMPVNALKPLIKKPNPIPMSKWLTIGALDPDEWTTLFGRTGGSGRAGFWSMASAPVLAAGRCACGRRHRRCPTSWRSGSSWAMRAAPPGWSFIPMATRDITAFIPPMANSA